jgi:hypothetical protein
MKKEKPKLNSTYTMSSRRNMQSMQNEHVTEYMYQCSTHVGNGNVHDMHLHSSGTVKDE